MKNISAYSRSSKNLVTYFILAYAISWSVGIPLALGEQGIIPKLFPLWAHYFVAYGPMLSALILTWFNQGQRGLRGIYPHSWPGVGTLAPTSILLLVRSFGRVWMGH